MRTNSYYWLTFLILSALAACYPKGANYTEELDLVYTNYNKDFGFKSVHTFAISDSVIKITGQAADDPDGNHRPDMANPTYAAALVNTIKQSMATYGWTVVDKNSNPDMIILCATMTTTNIYYYYDWWYWGWYYPGYNPGWGWYYPGWYYPPYVTGYRSGSAFIQMTLHNPPPGPGENIAVEWNAILNGLAEGSTSSIATRIQTGVNQAFAQSPYLKIN